MLKEEVLNELLDEKRMYDAELGDIVYRMYVCGTKKFFGNDINDIECNYGMWKMAVYPVIKFHERKGNDDVTDLCEKAYNLGLEQFSD